MRRESRGKQIVRILELFFFLKENTLSSPYNYDSLGDTFECCPKTIRRDVALLEQLKLIEPVVGHKNSNDRTSPKSDIVLRRSEYMSHYNNMMQEVFLQAAAGDPAKFTVCNGCKTYTFKLLPNRNLDMRDFRRHKAECKATEM